MRFVFVAGARPNFMKVAPLLRRARQCGHDCLLVHTGQHYDRAMSQQFFLELGIPQPDHNLEVGSGSHAQQTAAVMQRFEPVLIGANADWIVSVGDVNSTLACALVAAKLRTSTRNRIAHVEAGLRSRNWGMPEEVNRVLTDQLSDALLTPSPDASENLAAEGLPADRIVNIGNLMIDTLVCMRDEARERRACERFALRSGEYGVVTLHRPSNVDAPECLEPIVKALDEISRFMPIVFPMHPRTRATISRFGFDRALERITVVEPLGYVDMLSVTDAARIVLTDSGGLQEETTAVGVPCLTLREETERPVTITLGTNRLAPWPLTTYGIVSEVRRMLVDGQLPRRAACMIPGSDGHAAHRALQALETPISLQHERCAAV